MVTRQSTTMLHTILHTKHMLNYNSFNQVLLIVTLYSIIWMMPTFGILWVPGNNTMPMVSGSTPSTM